MKAGDYRAGMFHKNFGMRIDLVYANDAFAAGVRDAYVDREARKGKGPSDHAPVVVDVAVGDLDLPVPESTVERRPAVEAVEVAVSPPAAPAAGQAISPPEATPEFSPMPAEGSHQPFDDPGWRFEPKLDGVRTLAYVSPTATRLVSAAGQDHSAQYPELGHLAPFVHAASALVVREDKPMGRVVTEDKPAGLVVREETAKSARAQVGGRELVLSNLGKVLYPAAGFTKRDVIDYYAAIAPVLLPHLGGRALTVKRYPDGVDGKAFYEKQAPAHRPEWVQTVAVASERREQMDYTVAQDLATLVWLANLAALELHAPLGRAAAQERPTTLVFDLDPGLPATIVECCHVGLLLHGMFEALGLESFAKTSGSKGLQVYVPLNSDVTFAQTKPFARQVAELLERAEPDRIVSRQAKALRPGKVLIDWSQNDEHKTTVCVYSLRALQRPTVSTPVDWDEVRAALDSGDPHHLAFTSDQTLDRVAGRGDLLAPVLSLVQILPGHPA